MNEALEERRHNGGYSWRVSGKGWWLQRCHKCQRENYVLAVLTGICCWCGYNANAPEPADHVTTGAPTQ